jgi:hypothetical protein
MTAPHIARWFPGRQTFFARKSRQFGFVERKTQVVETIRLKSVGARVWAADQRTVVIPLKNSYALRLNDETIVIMK